MSEDSGRWVEVSSSQFPHEAEGLAIVRDLLPREAPFRAWSNFEFRDSHGRWHEVDLLLLARDGLHLIELKYYYGCIRGNDLTWLRDGHRAEDSPLKLARRKAQYFASKLKDEYRAWVRERQTQGAPDARDVIPFVKESVFLHHPQVVVDLPPNATQDLYGLDDIEQTTGLPGISELLSQPSRPNQQIREQLLVALMERIGLVQRREREAGSWVIEGAPIAEGEGWQDWLANHRVAQEERGRIRFQVTADGVADSERRRVKQIAEHEFRVAQRLNHDNILRPRDIVESDLGVGLVFPYDPNWQRLDLWLADHPQGLPLDTKLAILRQVGDALSYAHSNRVVHRGISPHAVSINDQGSRLRVRVTEWQSVGTLASEGTTASPNPGVTVLFRSSSAGDPGFAAPEGVYGQRVDRIRVDVFGLGALAFYLLTGQAPATTHSQLVERLRQQSGLDVSAELPEVSPQIRDAILAATRPAVTDRTPDVPTFLAALEAGEAPAPEVVDPLEATVGTVLDGRFTLLRRLGAGSTAVGLLVTDDAVKGTPERVLKVALDDAAAGRLTEEADVIGKLDSPRLVRLIEGPIEVGGRTALLLSSAGRETLAHELRQRPRISLDLLERWGSQLLDALVALDKAGVDHRDIKPANLGIVENRGTRAKELVLFDFSLSRAAATAIQAGTPPYLDPFLTSRGRFDSAAERYSAAAVLFEMATGHTPIYGDGISDPAAITDEASINAADFDETAGPRLVAYFTKALARDASKRHDTADQMLQEWRRCFPAAETTIPDNADTLAEQATLDTPLAQAGLSARALSALEPYSVKTVGDLLAVDPARLSRLGGTAEPTRKEVKSRASEWRNRLGRQHRGPWRPVTSQSGLASPTEIADQLIAAARGGRSTSRVDLVQRILGITGDVEAFATQAQLGASLPSPVTSMRIGQLIPELQETWGANETTRDHLDRLIAAIDDLLAELGGVAATNELSGRLLALTVPDPASDDRHYARVVDGLLRVALDRRHQVSLVDDDVADYAQRRREGRPLLIAVDPTLLQVAEDLGHTADSLVSSVNRGPDTDAIVPAPRAAAELTATLGRAEVPSTLREPARLARLAAATSTIAGASTTHELHHRGLSPARALALTLTAVTATQVLDPSELRARVQARFPSLPPLPERPQLDAVVEASGLGLLFDDRRRAYRPREVGPDTTGLESRPATVLVRDLPPISTLGATGQRLADSIAHTSFLALGVTAPYVDKLTEVLATEYGATTIDLTQELITAIRGQADERKVPWALALAADAEAATGRAGQGLRALVNGALPAVDKTIEQALHSGEPGPVVLTDASLLRRYDALGSLSRWMDLTTPRGRAVWLVVPQLHANLGPLIDGRPLPLSSPNQFTSIPSEWIDSRRHKEVSTA